MAETLKHATVRFYLRDSNCIRSITSCYLRQPAKSFLFPITNKGIPDKLLFWSSSCNWALARSILPTLYIFLLWSYESATKIITSESLQNFYHDYLNLVWPPKSHNFIDTFPTYFSILPFLISCLLNPIVGMVSSSKVPSVIALTNVVFPAFWSPTMAIYSYLLKNFDLSQSRILLKKENISLFLSYYVNLL